MNILNIYIYGNDQSSLFQIEPSKYRYGNGQSSLFHIEPSSKEKNNNNKQICPETE